MYFSCRDHLRIYENNLMYVNDMPDVVKDSSISLYADDTVLLNYGKNMINEKTICSRT